MQSITLGPHPHCCFVSDNSDNNEDVVRGDEERGDTNRNEDVTLRCPQCTSILNKDYLCTFCNEVVTQYEEESIDDSQSMDYTTVTNNNGDEDMDSCSLTTNNRNLLYQPEVKNWTIDTFEKMKQDANILLSISHKGLTIDTDMDREISGIEGLLHLHDLPPRTHN